MLKTLKFALCPEKANMADKIDILDLKIINQLQKDGRMSITEIAEKVGSSRPTTTNRLKKLIDNNLVTVKGGLNMCKFGYKMACIGLEVTNRQTLNEIEETMKCCPRVMNIYRTTEKANLHVTLWGEDDQSVNSTIESYRGVPNVNVVYAHYLGTPIHGDVAINLCSNGSDELPCGKENCNCHRYESGWCLGCPVSSKYKNPILK